MTVEIESTAGRLLVAEPGLGDPNFERSVVLMIEHTDAGAVGVVLNRPTELRIGEVLADWAPLAAEPAVLHVGGPVSESSVLGLARRRNDRPPIGWSSVLDDIGTLDLHLEAADLLGELDGLRLFAGYSGWGPGQLEFELEEGAWFVVDAHPGDVLHPVPGALWRAVLRRQSGRLRLLADYPMDVSVN